MLPLEGIKILDFTRVHVGPVCTQTLGDMGADVYKIESIGTGDITRSLMTAEELNGESHSFLSLNRNKKSICLDLRQPEAKKIVFQLASQCDVAVQNFRPGVMGRLGLDYCAMQQHNSRIVYASASGYGLTGPYRMKPGQDYVAQCMSGAAWQTGARNGPPGTCGVPVADHIAGMLLVQGIMAAIMVREKTGEGQQVSVSLLDAMLSPQREVATGYLSFGLPHRKSDHPAYHCYRAQDGEYLALAGTFTENALRDICEALGLPDLSQDERFDTTEKARFTNADALEAILAERFLTKPRNEWLDLLNAKDVFCGPVNKYEDTFSDPQILHNDMILEFEHPRAGKVRTVGMPIKFSKTPGRLRLVPPLLGQHTDEILTDLGYCAEQIRQLRDKKVVG